MWPRDGCVPPHFLEVDNFLSFVDFLPGPWGRVAAGAFKYARLSHGGGPGQVPRISGQSGLLPWPALWMRFLRTDHFMDICLGAVVSKGMRLQSECSSQFQPAERKPAKTLKSKMSRSNSLFAFFYFYFLCICRKF